MLGLLRRNMLPIQSDILTRRFLVPTPSPPPLPLPSPRETHFWYVIPDEVKDDFLLNRYVELLSPCERRSILQMNNDKVQKGALLARALVRTTLARYTNGKAGPSSLQFRKNRFGKPEIGIDVEEKQRKMRNNILSFAQRYFSSCEVEFLQSFSDPESQRQEFIKIWTLKEAYVKALGRGFSAAPFRDFSIRFEKSKGQMFPTDSETAPRIVVEVSDTSESLTSNWQFALFELDGSHYAAVCVGNNNDCTGSKRNPLNLKVWKTIPLVEDENVLNKNAVLNISGLS